MGVPQSTATSTLRSVLLFLGLVLVELGKKLAHGSRVKHFLNLDNLSLFIEPKKHGLLVPYGPNGVSASVRA
jgi:hypothetical protein